MNARSSTRTKKHAVSVAVTAAVAMLVGACTSSGQAHGSNGSNTNSSQSSAATTGGSMTMGIALAPDSLDPNVASSGDDALIMRQIFDSLVAETSSHKIEPWLATKWSVSADGKQYTFTLKQGVRFQDGSVFDAQAVKDNITRILDPATKSQYAAALLGPVKSATVVSKYVVRLNLSARDIGLLSALSQPFLGMESPAAVQKYGGTVGTHPVGTGPFVFTSETSGQQVVLSANPHYTSPPGGSAHHGRSYLDKITFTVVPEATSRVGGLQSKQLTAIEVVPAQQIAALRKQSGITVDLHDAPGAVYTLYPNERVSPWNQTAARIALREGIDVDAIIKTLYFGQYKRAWSVLSPATTGYDQSLVNSWSYNPTAATKAFESLGYTMGSDGYLQKNGQVLSILMVNNSPDYDQRFEIDTIVQQQLKKVGVKEVISDVPFAQYASATEQGKYGMESFTVQTSTPAVLDTIFNSKNQPDAHNFLYNVAHYSSATMDRLGKLGASAATQAQANHYYAQMQQIINKEALAIPIYVGQITFACQSNLQGVTFDPVAYPSFYDAHL